MRIEVSLIVVGLIGSVLPARPDGPGPTTRARYRPPGVPPVVTFTAREYGFDGPDSIESGPTTLRLVSAGREQHFLGLVRITGSHSMTDYRHVLTGEVTPPWIIPVGGVGTISPGGAAMTTLDLEPGLYAMLCDIQDPQGKAHWQMGMLRSLTVLPRANGAATPSPDVKIDLTEFAFMGPETLQAGLHLMEVRNVGSQPHMALVWRLVPSGSAKAVIHWLDTPSDTSHPVALVGGVPDLAPGRWAQLHLPLQAGHYLMICLVGDSSGGTAHYHKGMIRELTVVPMGRR